MALTAAHHVVIVGAGFGGLQVARHLSSAPVRVTIIDRRNHHLFQPLLYQVATASLATSDIAWPIRSLLHRRKNITTLLGIVVGVNSPARQVLLADEEPVSLDTLVLATGARHANFGHDGWEPYAPGLKTLEDAITVRRRILSAFEQAEWETDSVERGEIGAPLEVIEDRFPALFEIRRMSFPRLAELSDRSRFDQSVGHMDMVKDPGANCTADAIELAVSAAAGPRHRANDWKQ